MDMSFLALSCAILALLAFYLRHRFWSFSAQKPSDYAAAENHFDLRTHLNGPILCEGVIYGPLGRVTSRFVGHFDARWDGNVGIMTETFTYEDGSTQDRIWNLRIGNDGKIVATAPDVIGVGEGYQSGSAVQLKYRIRLSDDAGGHILDTVDWMYLAPNGTIVNRSQFRKFGIKVAELVATMRPAAEAGQSAA